MIYGIKYMHKYWLAILNMSQGHSDTITLHKRLEYDKIIKFVEI